MLAADLDAAGERMLASEVRNAPTDRFGDTLMKLRDTAIAEKLQTADRIDEMLQFDPRLLFPTIPIQPPPKIPRLEDLAAPLPEDLRHVRDGVLHLVVDLRAAGYKRYAQTLRLALYGESVETILVNLFHALRSQQFGMSRRSGMREQLGHFRDEVKAIIDSRGIVIPRSDPARESTLTNLLDAYAAINAFSAELHTLGADQWSEELYEALGGATVAEILFAARDCLAQLQRATLVHELGLEDRVKTVLWKVEAPLMARGLLFGENFGRLYRDLQFVSHAEVADLCERVEQLLAEIRAKDDLWGQALQYRYNMDRELSGALPGDALVHAYVGLDSFMNSGAAQECGLKERTDALVHDLHPAVRPHIVEPSG
jgi:hypothetical protein